ncbi:MAG: MBL fold metallo-hydrolase [Caulobacteraceae bacterium]|nr:MBL fold metallo-hydrolase [Caulobacteraceae bacterium]
MIPFVRDLTFEYGRVDQVSPLIRRVVANNPGPFTFNGTGVYIVGSGEVAVIDPGPDLSEHLDALLAALRGETVTAILTTHTHADHSPLARPLAERTGATIYGRPAPGAGEHAVKLDEGHDELFRPDVAVTDGQTIAGPGWTLEALATPGHASNHVCYALLEENALFSGDHVMGWSTTVISPPDGDMTAYYASLDKVARRGFATLWPTHGPPITEVAPFLAAYKAHRLDRERQILEQLDAGHGRIREMVPVIYAAVDPRLHPAAAHSVLAHMIHLTRQGVVATDGEPGPDSVYRRA